jgi:hypothetical protein
MLEYDQSGTSVWKHSRYVFSSLTVQLFIIVVEQGQPYLLYPYLDRAGQCKVAAFYHPSATVDDRIQSVLHAAYLERHLTGIIHIDSPDTPKEIMENAEVLEGALEHAKRWITLYHHEFRTLLYEKEWRMDEIAFAETGRRVLWGRAAEERPAIVEERKA